MKSIKPANISFSISPMTRWVITLVILAVLLAVVVVLYVGEQSRNSDLESKLENAQSSLLTNSVKKDALELRKTRATLALARWEDEFVSPTQSISFEEAIYRTAYESGIMVHSISCEKPQAQTVDGQTYDVYQVIVDVEGDVDGALRFMAILGEWVPAAGIGESIAIEKLETGQTGLNVTLNVYALAE